MESLHSMAFWALYLGDKPDNKTYNRITRGRIPRISHIRVIFYRVLKTVRVQLTKVLHVLLWKQDLVTIFLYFNLKKKWNSKPYKKCVTKKITWINRGCNLLKVLFSIPFNQLPWYLSYVMGLKMLGTRKYAFHSFFFVVLVVLHIYKDFYRIVYANLFFWF